VHAGRFIITGLPGTQLPAELAALWRRYRVGGVILFRHNVAGPEQLRKLVADLLEVLGPEALISVDQEGGAVLRLPFLPGPPPGMSLGPGGSRRPRGGPRLPGQVGKLRRRTTGRRPPVLC